MLSSLLSVFILKKLKRELSFWGPNIGRQDSVAEFLIVAVCMYASVQKVSKA